MALGARDALGTAIERALVITKDGHVAPQLLAIPGVEVHESAHPMPDEREPLPEADDPYEQCNLWMLREALGFGAERVRFVCLWNGGGGDGPGGTAHMKQSVERAGGSVVWLDTRNLWKL